MWRNVYRGRLVVVVAVALGGAVAVLPFAAAQEPVVRTPFRSINPVALPFDRLDRDEVWTMHFAYLPPRIVTVNTPDGTRRQAWYMVYQVWNRSDTPQTIVPEFELVTKDGRLQNFLDQPLPFIVDEIRRIEDKTGAYQLKTSIGISAQKIPVTKPDSIPRAVYGVAVWVDAPQLAAASNNFSVYVSGLSNGVAASQNDAGEERISKKTLQIDFVRPTDNLRPQHDDFRVNDNNGLGAEKWVYRVTSARLPVVGTAPAAPPAAPAPEEKKDEKKEEK